MAGGGLAKGTERWLLRGLLFHEEGGPGESGT